jgi:transmembrane sensor
MIEQDAALWVLRREESGWSEEDERSLEAWLDESDAHKVAFWRLEAGWREADRIGSLGQDVPIRRRFDSSNWWPSGAAIAASLLLVFTLLLSQGPTWRTGDGAPRASLQYSTPIGGHQVVELKDGSRVELNTDTAIKAAVDSESRSVWLNRGEAFFDVAKRNGRKFVIYAGQRKITVLGTKFSVRRTDNEVVVAVLEGRVRVDDVPSTYSDRQETVSAGDVAIATDGNTLVTNSSAAVRQQLAWRDGLLVFDGTTLASAASQFNRYNSRPLAIADREAAALLVQGSFRAANVSAFTAMLKEAYGVLVDERQDRTVIASRRLASKTLPKQLRPGLTQPRMVSDASASDACGARGESCAMIPLSSRAPAVSVASVSDVKKAARDAKNFNVLQKLYPARALAAGEEGSVGFIVRIDGGGNPTQCKITRTSGHPLLDLETCQLILVHATFKKPNGVSLSQQKSYEGVVNWTLPANRPASPSPLATAPTPEKPAVRSAANDELICRTARRIGSNVATERRCMTRGEWQRASDEVKRIFDHF